MAPSRNTSLIRRASPEDATHIRSIARAAYAKYTARIGREPAPMVADFAAEIAADHVVVIETAGMVAGYMVAWSETDACPRIRRRRLQWHALIALHWISPREDLQRTDSTVSRSLDVSSAFRRARPRGLFLAFSSLGAEGRLGQI